MKKPIFVTGSSEFPLFYFLDYDSMCAQFYYDIPINLKEVYEVCNIQIKNFSETLILCIDKKYKDKFKVQKSFYESNLGIMKSHLQKCIRRGETQLAIQTGKYMIEKGQLGELLRRLYIICIEDTILNKHLVTLTWLMCVGNKNYIFDDNMNSWILGFVKQVTEDKFYDHLDYGVEINSVSKKDLINYLKKVNKNSLHKDLIMSLIVRKSYGGMSGDMKMISRYIILWMKRFEEGAGIHLKHLVEMEGVSTP